MALTQDAPLPPWNPRSARLHIQLVYEDAVRSAQGASRVRVTADLYPGTVNGTPRVVTDTVLRIFGQTLFPRRGWDNSLRYEMTLPLPADSFDRPWNLDPPDVAGLAAAVPLWQVPAKLDGDVVTAGPRVIRLRFRSAASVHPNALTDYAGWSAQLRTASESVSMNGDRDPPPVFDIPLVMLRDRNSPKSATVDYRRTIIETPQPDNSYTVFPTVTVNLGWTITGGGQ